MKPESKPQAMVFARRGAYAFCLGIIDGPYVSQVTPYLDGEILPGQELALLLDAIIVLGLRTVPLGMIIGVCDV